MTEPAPLTGDPTQDAKLGPSETKPLQGGELLTGISNMIVGMLRERYGRGPMRAKTYVMDDLIVCVLRDGFTKVEASMDEAGRTEQILEMRRDFQVIMGPHYRREIEALSGSKVTAFMSQAHLDPDITVEIFIVDPPIDLRAVVETNHSNNSDDD